MFGPHAQNSALVKATLLEVFSGQLSRAGAAQRLTLSEDALEAHLERALEAGLQALEAPEPTPTFFSDVEFARMLRHSAVPWAILTLGEGRFLETSRATLELLGYSASELLNHTALELNLWVNLAEREHLLETLRRDGQGRGFEVRLKAKDGSERTVLLEAQCFQGEQRFQGEQCFQGEREIHTLYLFQDLTASRAVEHALIRSKSVLEAQLEAAPDGILVINEHRQLVSFNRRYQELWGLPDEMMRQGSTSNRLRWMADQMQDPVSYIARVNDLHGRPLESARDELHLLDGRTLDRRSGPVVSSEGHLFGRVWFFRDISEEKQRESVQRAAREAADAANRAKSHFLANMSHELRTPLNAILGFAQVLARDSGLSKVQLEQVRIMGRSGEHLLGLINDVLEMSKIEAGRVSLNESRFDLHRLLFSLLEMLRPRAVAKNLTLESVQAPEVAQFVFGDESKLRQILINLLGNALKFTATGQVRLEVTSTGEKLRFEVSDSGFGIEAEALSTLFDPFVQSASGRQSLEGTGLGLPISRQFVRLMGGDIAVSSAPGVGSTFSFEVSLESADLSDSSDIGLRQVMALAPDERGQVPHIRILAVDDKWENRQLLVQMLGGVGFEVREAENGAVALEQWRQWQPQLILMDMRMPIMDGFEATRRIRAESGTGTVKIVALTASAFAEQRTEVLAAGCNDFVPKPFREHQLFECLALHLGLNYRYREAQNSVEVLEQKENADLYPTDLLAADLLALGLTWRTQLLEAATSGDDEHCLELLLDLTPKHPALSRTLQGWVNEFRFRDLRTLLQTLRREDVLNPDL